MVSWLKTNKWLILIILVASFLRVYRLDYLELFGDELDAGYQSYSLLMTGRDYKGQFLPTYVHSFSEWRAPGLMYAMAPFIKIFGLDEWGVRLCPVFFGVLGIIGFYFLLKKIGIKKNVCLWSIFMLSINPWHIQYSRTGFELTLLSSLILWGTYFLVKGIKLNKCKWLLISGILFSAGLYTYSTANIYVPLIALVTLIIFKAKKKQFLMLLFTGLIFSSPIVFQIIFGHAADRFGTLSILNNKEIIAQVNDYRNAGKNSLLSKIFYNKVILSGKRVVFNYTNALGSNFLFNEGDVTFRHSLHRVGNLFWIELPLIILGLIYVLKQKKESLGLLWLLGLFLIFPLPSSLTYDGYNHASRLFLLIFPLSFFAAYGLENIKGFVKILLLLVLFIEFINFQYYYWNFYRNESWRWWHTGYKEAMLYISDNKNDYKMVLMNNTYEPALIRFLFWNKIYPNKVFNLADKMIDNIDGFEGYCLDEKYCFVNFSNKFQTNKLNKNILYFISQEREVGGDWDWSKNPPEGVKVLKTVRNYDGTPIFYLVTKM